MLMFDSFTNGGVNVDVQANRKRKARFRKEMADDLRNYRCVVHHFFDCRTIRIMLFPSKAIWLGDFRRDSFQRDYRLLLLENRHSEFAFAIRDAY